MVWLTLQKIKEILEEKRLEQLVTITNPLDINPASDDGVHASITAIALEDSGVDAAILSLDPLSPAMHTLDKTELAQYDMHDERGIIKLLTDLEKSLDKPLVTVVDGGRLYDPLRDALIKKGIPVFTVCDRAVAVLSIYIQGRLQRDAIIAAG